MIEDFNQGISLGNKVRVKGNIFKLNNQKKKKRVNFGHLFLIKIILNYV